MHFVPGAPEGYEPGLGWLRDLPIPVYGLPEYWLGLRMLGDSQHASGQESGHDPVVSYSVQLRHIDLAGDPPLSSLYVETSTEQEPMGDQYIPRGLLNGKPFDWPVFVNGEPRDFRAVRGPLGLVLAKGTVDGATVTVIAANWATIKPLDLTTITDLSPYIEERNRIIGF